MSYMDNRSILQKADMVLSDLTTGGGLPIPVGHDVAVVPVLPPIRDFEIVTLGTDGDLVCADAATGDVRWSKSFVPDFGGQFMAVWKFSESPLPTM